MPSRPCTNESAKTLGRCFFAGKEKAPVSLESGGFFVFRALSAFGVGSVLVVTGVTVDNHKVEEDKNAD